VNVSVRRPCLALVSVLALALACGPHDGASARSHGAAPATAFTPGPDETPNPSGLYLPRSVPKPKPAAAPSPEATPTSPAFTTLDGTWEVQVQRGARTSYEHFTLKQAGNAVTGTWNVDKKTALPLSGSYDGHDFKFTAHGPGGPVALSGYVDDASDMVGAYPEGKGLTAFTATHRKKGSTPIGITP